VSNSSTGTPSSVLAAAAAASSSVASASRSASRTRLSDLGSAGGGGVAASNGHDSTERARFASESLMCIALSSDGAMGDDRT
jgi:hypothetical protein